MVGYDGSQRFLASQSSDQKQPENLRDDVVDSDGPRRDPRRLSAYANYACAFVEGSIRNSPRTRSDDWFRLFDDGANGVVSNVAGNFAG